MGDLDNRVACSLHWKNDDGDRHNSRFIRPMRFTHIKLSNWRNFRSVDVSLAERTFLFGPNGSGKSNFLDAIRFLRDIADRTGGLGRAVEERGGMRAIRSHYATKPIPIQPGQNHDQTRAVLHGVEAIQSQEPPNAADFLTGIPVRIEVHMEIDGKPWRYALEIDNNSWWSPVVIKEEVDGPHGPLIRRPDAEDNDDSERLTQTYLEQVSANKPFRKLAEMLASVEYSHIVPELVRDPRPRSARDPMRDPYGTELLSSIANLSPDERDRRLRALCQQLSKVISGLAEIQYKPEHDAPHIGLRLASLPHEFQREDQLSDGTLRLLGLLWVLGAGNSPVLLEEPEMSLHVAAVRQIPQVLARVASRHHRQTLVSTHSQDLLADTGIDPSEILILFPAADGTNVSVGSDDPALVALARADAPLGGLLVAKTKPADIIQLASAFGGDDE